jgi:hypothetical protein
MAGIFGDEINSRADFFKVLNAARRNAAAALRKMPQDPTLNSVSRQLEAIERWTANGRSPSPDERNSVALGLRMSREFEGFDDDDIDELTERAVAIQNYFRHWPEDAIAGAPDNKRYF